jgi:hypothetical protein
MDRSSGVPGDSNTFFLTTERRAGQIFDWAVEECHNTIGQNHIYRILCPMKAK